MGAIVFLSSTTHAAVISRLPNGLTVITDPRPGSTVTAIQLWERVGSVNEEEKTLGLAHFMEHMLFKGTTTRDVGMIHAEVERNGGDMNAATSEDWTYYHITIPSAEWKKALDILLDIAANATFPESEVAREREVIKEEIARRDDNPIALLYDNLGRAAYKVHPYRWRVIGDDTSLNRITRPVFLSFYRKHYRPDRQAIVLVGDIDTAYVARRVAETLGKILRGKPLRERPRPVEPPTVPSALTIPAKTVLTYGAVSYPGPAARDLRANVAGDILSELLTGSGVGRLTRRLVESERIADAVDASFPTSQDPARFSITYTATPANRSAIEDEVRKEIRNLVTDGVTAEELSTVVDRMKRERRLRNESSEARAFNIGFWFAVTRPEDADAYERALDAATPALVNTFARKYLDERHAVTVAVEPSASGRDARGEGVAGLPDSALIWRPSSGELAAIGLFIAGGQSQEPQPGWAAMLAGVMNRGVMGKTHEDFERDLAGLGLTVSASSAPDLFSIIGTCEPSRAGLLVNTLFDVISNPNMSDIEIVRESLLDSLRSRADRPFDTALDRLNRLRFGVHPYGRPDAGDETGVIAASAETLRDYLASLHRRDLLKVVVVGAADTMMIRRVVSERLSDWSGEPPPPPPSPPALAPSASVETAPTSQTIVLRSIVAPTVLDPDYPKWKVANAILGGRSASRLFTIIREERGLAYEVGSFFATRRLAGQLVFFAGCRPRFAKQVRALYPDALGPPTSKELDDAVRSLTGDFALDHERAARRAWYLGWYATIGLDPAFDEAYPDLVRRVTLDDVAGVFARIRSASPIDLTYGAASAGEGE